MRNEPEMYFYIAERGWPKDYIFGIDLSSLEKKKKKKKTTLPYIRASHLV